jgi:hypothetical protein
MNFSAGAASFQGSHQTNTIMTFEIKVRVERKGGLSSRETT